MLWKRKKHLEGKAKVRRCSNFFEWHHQHYYSLTFDDVSLKTDYSEVNPKDVNLNTKITKNVRLGIPIASAAMGTITEYKLALIMAKTGGIGFIHKNLSPKKQAFQIFKVKEESDKFLVGAAISDNLGEENLYRLKLLLEQKTDVILVDSAHGDTLNMINMIRFLNKNYPEAELLIGNISEPESAKRLMAAGQIQGIKVGQGPGSICSTRKIAGIGCPQLTAIYEITKIAGKKGIPVCADGGIRYSGDIVKALGAGAHTVMLGSLLAGTEETPSKKIRINKKLYKAYRGMGSEAAMRKNKASRERYKQESIKDSIPEGVEGIVEYKGSAAEQIKMLTGGLRNGMGYTGCKDIEELRNKADFRRITPAGAQESMPHSIKITKKPSNL
jgi:IMP dehydrogenase